MSKASRTRASCGPRDPARLNRTIATVFVVLAMMLVVWACHESPTRPPDPAATDVASTGALEKKGGGGGGKEGPTLYDVIVTGAFEFSATLEAITDNRRKFALGGDEPVSMKLQFSTDTVAEANCHWTDGYDWDDAEIVALRDSLTTYDNEAVSADFTYFRQLGRGMIRRRGPWTMYCVEEDGTSGGCDATETVEPDGTLVFELNGSTTSPTRWVRVVGDKVPGGGKENFEVRCRDQESAPTVIVRATPAS